MPIALLAALLFALCSCIGGEPERSAAAPTREPSMTAAASPAPTPAPGSQSGPSSVPAPPATDSEIATFGAGCFWCVEAVLERLPGVLDVSSGYMGGTVENPTYTQVCTGETGHAEVVQVRFDPRKLPYCELLDWFWRLHDPTTMNRQGADEGTQYRSAIFYHSEAQREIALRSKKEASDAFVSPIVTEITPAGTFHPAEEYHQDYFRLNPRAGYCRVVIAPKLEKLGVGK